MFSEDGLVTKSLEEMKKEIEDLLADASRLKSEHDNAQQRIDELRRESIDSRPLDAKKAELLWNEAENLLEESKEMLRLSVEKTLNAGEIKSRLKIRSQIEAIDNSDEIWRKAVRAGRS
jgi:hypothetical protein